MDYKVRDQLAATIVDEINSQRTLDELTALQGQDAALLKAAEQIDKVREFVGSPGNILGNANTKHGEIAEAVEVGVRNARAALAQADMTASFDGVGRFAAADYIVDGALVQSKFINGANNTLSHVLDHMDKYQTFGRDVTYYHIPKDQYSAIQEMLHGQDKTGLSQRSIDAILQKVTSIENAAGRPFDEVVRPGVSDYAEVQIGTVSHSLDKHTEELQKQNDALKGIISDRHQPSFREGAQAAAGAAAVGAALCFTVSTYKKYREGKNVFRGQFTRQDWKDVGVDAAKGGAGGAVSGAALYILTNSAELAAPFAGAMVSAVKGVGELALQLHAGKITLPQFIDSGLIVCSESAIIGICTAAGQTLIPVPILGAMIGAIAGKVLLLLAGKLVKKLKPKLDEILKGFRAGLDTAYENLIRAMEADFERLGDLTRTAFSVERNVDLLQASVLLARAYGVNESRLLKSEQDVDTYMLH
jgi:hypothetical protein